MSRFTLEPLALPGLVRVLRHPRGDARGSFQRFFCVEELAEAGWSGPVAQINLTRTAARHTVRGMHFQYPPHAELKFVSCLRGRVWDVLVDLRAGSPTFMQSLGVELDGDIGYSLLVPKGLAHGFQTLTNDVEMLYLHSHPFTVHAEGGVRPDDPRLGIQWPEQVQCLSERDLNHPLLNDDFTGLQLS